jgi:hypothetical protein
MPTEASVQILQATAKSGLNLSQYLSEAEQTVLKASIHYKKIPAGTDTSQGMFLTNSHFPTVSVTASLS